MTSKPERYLIVFCSLLISAFAIPAMMEWWRGEGRGEAKVSARED